MSGYLYLPGTAGNDVSTAYYAALGFTGDFDWRVAVAADDWTPGASQHFGGRRDPASGSSIFGSYIATDGKPHIQLWDSGATLHDVFSTDAPAIVDGAKLGIGYTVDVNNGAAGFDVTFSTKTINSHADLQSDTGWTQLGTVVTTAGAITMAADANTGMILGTWKSGAGIGVAGDWFGAILKNGIAGTAVFDADFTDLTLAETATGSFVEDSASAATVTINGTAWKYIRSHRASPIRRTGRYRERTLYMVRNR